MTDRIPPIQTRAAFVDQSGRLTREGQVLLEAMRAALGGDAATTGGSVATADIAPVAVFGGAVGADLAPVGVAIAARDLPPV